VRPGGRRPSAAVHWHACVAFVVGWGLTGALTCLAALGSSMAPQPPPGSAGPLPASWWYLVMILAGLSWLPFAVTWPPLMVIAGLARLRTGQTRWRWSAGWAATAASGVAVEALFIHGALASGGSSSGTHWGLLEMAAAFVAAGLAMIAVAARAAADARMR
jgi:hypothetical protein